MGECHQRPPFDDAAHVREGGVHLGRADRGGGIRRVLGGGALREVGASVGLGGVEGHFGGRGEQNGGKGEFDVAVAEFG